MDRLGIGRTIQRGFAAIWSQRRILGSIAFFWFWALTLFVFGYRYFGRHLRENLASHLAPTLPRVESWDWGYLFHLVAMIPYNLLGSVFVVLVMRTFLFSTPLRAAGGWSAFGGSVLAIFLFKYGLVVYHTVWRWMAFPHLGFLYPVLWTVFWLAGIAVTARFCFLYANASMGLGWRLRHCWRDAAGNGVRLFLLFLAINIPALVAGTVVEDLIIAWTYAPGSDWDLAYLAVLSATKSVATSTILLALIASAFAELTGFPAAGVPGSGRTPKELAAAFE